LRLCSKAIALDPDYALPYAGALWAYIWRKVQGWTIDRARDVDETEKLSRRAVELGRDDAYVLCWVGNALAQVALKHEEASVLIDRALDLNPNLARAWSMSGWLRLFVGEYEEAISHFARAMHLSPLDHTLPFTQVGTGAAHFFSDRHDDALVWLQRGLQRLPDYLLGQSVAAGTCALSGRMERAQKAIVEIQRIDPEMRLSNLANRFDMFRPDDVAKLGDGLRRAGLLE
jgi:tetratricopeptide (TPR) repeat protein